MSSPARLTETWDTSHLPEASDSLSSSSEKFTNKHVLLVPSLPSVLSLPLLPLPTLIYPYPCLSHRALYPLAFTSLFRLPYSDEAAPLVYGRVPFASRTFPHTYADNARCITHRPHYIYIPTGVIEEEKINAYRSLIQVSVILLVTEKIAYCQFVKQAAKRPSPIYSLSHTVSLRAT